jgi:hypothetical protein
MEKKILKPYETPTVEIIEAELEGFLCTSNPDNPLDGSTGDTEEME